ncbi:dihydroorotase [Halorubrum lacusprofundi]|jgi:dihydroorotase|uniref:Dihydroorotase n=1 Tax=Halorubrum lacusprofundi (strain ATCC 49239 / DSM 5036 / JCM 8891 / ACAM 34) TaxID=416348 RepID=B9LR01_HALLT|nr:dihydroorotase [Halorubrum lacusprofundi]ACM57655.1 dihydroorotase, multifunctional complex type [Halorubrum lacusprofundi ATCC 49239]MCG1005748.1 dihydroorotase [Halorubrum lacusprofundi]
MLITGAELADGRVRDVRIRDGTIDAVEPTNAGLDADTGERVVDARGRHLLPGAVDVHVHFREPGASHKETWTSGSRGAAAGGVTTVVDQPNTSPPTVDGDAFDEKAALAADSLVDYGINGGVTADWDPESLFERPLFALGEVFLADSTGDMGIALDLFEEALAEAAARDVPVTVHAEDETLFDESALDGDLGGVGTAANADAWSAYRTAEAETAAIERALDAGAESDAQVHIAHTSTPEGIDAVSDTDATCEVTPHHLFLSREDAGRLGTFGRMNPPLRSEERRAAVFERLRDGDVDVVATDHAPHTVAEKRQRLVDAPSGVPGVETLYPLLLESVRKGNLSLERVRDVVAANPASIFEIEGKGRIEPGADADLVVVDLTNPREIEAGALHGASGWTPFEGLQGVFPELTTVRGKIAYERDPVTGAESFGETVGRNVRES